VTEQRVEKYTVCTTRQVPYQATRQVRVCVPCEETYQACRMVSRQVARQVADTSSCCESSPCCDSGRGNWFRGMFNRGGHGHSHGHSQSSGCCN